MIIPALSEALAAKAVPALVTNGELSAAAFAPLFAALEAGGGAEVIARPAPRASGAADSLAGAAAALASPVRATPLPGARTDTKAPLRSGPGVTAPALATNVALLGADSAPLVAPVEEGGRPKVVARPALRAADVGQSLAGAAALALITLASPSSEVPLPGTTANVKAPSRTGPGVTAPGLAINVEPSAADFLPPFAPVEEGGRPKAAAQPALRAADVGQSLAGAAALALTTLASPAGEVPLPGATTDAKAPSRLQHAASANAKTTPAAPAAEHTGRTPPTADPPVPSEIPEVAPLDAAVLVRHTESTAAAKTLPPPVTGDIAPEVARDEPDEPGVVAVRVTSPARPAVPHPNESPLTPAMHATLAQGDATGASDPHGREPGRRATDAVMPDRSAGADRSAPNPLPPGTDAPPRAEVSAPRDLPPHAAPTHDLDHLARLAELRPAPRDELRLEISPDGLGAIEVRVAVRADGVHASLFAQHDQARDTLAQHRPLLETALQRSHLRLEGFTVDLGGRHHGAAADAHEPLPAIPPLPMTPTEDPLPAPASGLSVRA